MSAYSLIIMFLELTRNTELEQAGSIIMTQAKKIHILIIKVNKFFSFYFMKFPLVKHVLHVSIEL